MYMHDESAPVATLEKPWNGRLRLRFRDVTRSLNDEDDNIDPATPAGHVATAAAARMSLATDAPWTLRDDRTSALLQDEMPLGKQLSGDLREQRTLTLIPKAHLG